MSKSDGFKKVWDFGESQVAWLYPLKKGTPFRSLNKSVEGCTWLRLGRLLLTDCQCINLADGEARTK